MREIVLYSIAGISSLMILGYSVHMFVGGLVSQETETTLIIAICSIGAIVLAFMAWDVIRRRTKK